MATIHLPADNHHAATNAVRDALSGTRWDTVLAVHAAHEAPRVYAVELADECGNPDDLVATATRYGWTVTDSGSLLEGVR